MNYNGHDPNLFFNENVPNGPKEIKYLGRNLEGYSNVNELPIPLEKYKRIIQTPKIQKILNSIPQWFTPSERAYYLYLELGKILKEDSKFIFSPFDLKVVFYSESINEEFFGICKSISELYACLLDSIGIKSHVIITGTANSIGHVELLIECEDNKKFRANLIADLWRIKAGLKPLEFGRDFSFLIRSSIEKKFGIISTLNSNELDNLNAKMGYIYLPQDEERGIYTNDTIERLAMEFHDEALLKQYVFPQGKEISKNERLKYKLNYLIENLDKLTEFQGKKGDRGYFDEIRYLSFLIRELFCDSDRKRIHFYTVRFDDKPYNVLPIVKVNKGDSLKNNFGENWYYIFDRDLHRFKEISKQDLKKYFDSFDSNSVNIVGNGFDYYPEDLSELELEI